MKLYPAILVSVCLLSCTKSKTTVNNIPLSYFNSQPAFIVEGITDIKITNKSAAQLYYTVVYRDSAQERITLSLSELPDGIKIDTTWLRSGIPSFTTFMSVYDTTLTNGTIPGNYPMTLTATTTSGKVKSYLFYLRVE